MKKKQKNAQCEKCGRLIHPARSALQSVGVIFAEIPEYCPHCGAKLSDIKREQVDKYTDYLCILKCIPVVVFIVIIITIIIIAR
ncbi:MAG: hypothetical protein ACFFAK_14800 [Promethearchaeota archaeon]